MIELADEGFTRIKETWYKCSNDVKNSIENKIMSKSILIRSVR